MRIATGAARQTSRMTPVRMPLKELGRTMVRIVCQRDAPMFQQASRKATGTEASASFVAAMMTGRVMMPRVRDAAGHVVTGSLSDVLAFLAVSAPAPLVGADPPPAVVVEPGPAYAGPSVAVPWFVAVADPSGTIVDKQVFTSTVALSPGATRGGAREAIEQRYVGVEPAAGAGYRIYLGLEIDRDEALRRRSTLP